MKINRLLVVLVIAMLSCHSTPDETQAKRDELKNIVLDYFNALAKKDIQKANELTTSNFILFDEGAVFSNESAIKEVSKMKPFAVTFSFDSINVHMDKKNASAYYFRKSDFVFADSTNMTIRFLESATFNKEGDKWKLRFLHSSIRK